MDKSDTVIRRYVTKPRIYFEAIHFRAKAGTRARIEALRGDQGQGEFVRDLLEEALDRKEKAAARKAKKD